MTFAIDKRMGVALATQTPAKDKSHGVLVNYFTERGHFNNPKVISRQSVSVVKVSGCTCMYSEAFIKEG